MSILTLLTAASFSGQLPQTSSCATLQGAATWQIQWHDPVAIVRLLLKADDSCSRSAVILRRYKQNDKYHNRGR